MSARNKRRIAPSALVALVALGTAAPAEAGQVVTITMAQTGQTIFNTMTGVVVRPTSTSFSLHGGAMTTGGPLSVTQRPDLGRPATRIFPTMLSSGLVRTGADGSGRVNGQVVRPATLPMGVRYDTLPKSYNSGRVETSGAASSVGGTAPNQTVSVGEASAVFNSMLIPAGGTRKTEGVLAEVVPIGTRAAITKDTPTSPGGMAGALILDPITFPDPRPGDQLSGSLLLGTGGFSVTIDDPNGVAGSFTQAGSDFPAPTNPDAGRLGLTFQGLPVIYTLYLTFHGDDLLHPEILFNYNTSYTFLDPDDGKPITGDVAAFVKARLEADLTLSSPDTVTLADNVDLFDYTATAPDDAPALASFQAEYDFGIFAETVPEPATLVMIASGALALLAHRRVAGGGRG